MKIGCAPRRSSPQSTNRAERSGRALPPNQRCRCRNGPSDSRSMRVRTLPSSSVSHATPMKKAGRASAATAAAGSAHFLHRDRRRRLLQAEPVEGVARQRQEVRQVADARELGQAEHLDRRHALARRQVELDRLRRPRQVGDAEHLLVLVARARRRAPCGSPGDRNSSVPRPNTLNCLRSAISRFIQLSSENGERSCASTLIAW